MTNSPPSRNQGSERATPLDGQVAAFHASWKSAAKGQAAPRLESVLETVLPTQRTAYLRQYLVIELEWRVKLGEHPVVDEYLARFPADADTIRDVFDVWVAVANLEPSPKTDVGPPVDSNEQAERVDEYPVNQNTVAI